MFLKVCKRFLNLQKGIAQIRVQPFSVQAEQFEQQQAENVESFKIKQDSIEEDESEQIALQLLQTSMLYQNTPGNLHIDTLKKNFKYNQQEIYSLGVNLHPPDYNLKEDSNVVFVRHAYSYHNYFIDKYITSQNVQNKQLKQLIKDKMFSHSQEFIDSPLHPYGLIQCKNKVQQIHKMNIGCVLVSPMQRTLQTCIELFKDHPKKKYIQFIIQPSVSEQLTKISDIFDQEKFVSFIKNSYQKHGISFNCRYFYKHQWQANIIDQKYLKMPINSSDSEQEVSGEDDAQQFNAIERHLADTDTIMNLMDYYKNQPLERHSSFVKRVLYTNKHIKKSALKFKENSVNRNKQQQMICVISHGYFIDTLFRKCFKEKHRPVSNCSFIFQSYTEEENVAEPINQELKEDSEKQEMNAESEN